MAKNKFIAPREEAIANLIRDWRPEERLNWQAVCRKAEKILGYMPTRQGLAKNPLIADTFKAKKRGVRIKPKASEPLPSSLAAAARRIANLNIENDRLTRENAELNERFVRWQYNAYKKGIRNKQLDEPMPAIDRDVTEFADDRKGMKK